MIRLLHQHPTLLSLNSFAGLKYVADKAKKASESCGCNATQVYQEHARDFELALQNINNGDHLVIKQILGVNQICYYIKKSTGQFELRCI